VKYPFKSAAAMGVQKFLLLSLSTHPTPREWYFPSLGQIIAHNAIFCPLVVTGQLTDALSKICRDSITGRDAGTTVLRAFSFQCGWYLAFYLCYILFINSNSNINRRFITFYRDRIGALVLKNMWCWTDGFLLSRLQWRGNVVPAWIVIIAHWTTVSLSTASQLSRHLCRRLCLL